MVMHRRLERGGDKGFEPHFSDCRAVPCKPADEWWQKLKPGTRALNNLSLTTVSWCKLSFGNVDFSILKMETQTIPTSLAKQYLSRSFVRPFLGRRLTIQWAGLLRQAPKPPRAQVNHPLQLLSHTLLNHPLGIVCCSLIWPQSLNIRDCAAIGVWSLCEGDNGCSRDYYAAAGSLTHWLHVASYFKCTGGLATYRSPGVNPFANSSFLI